MSVSRTFVDTNVLLYSLDDRDTRKRDIARKIIIELCRSGNGQISMQVVNEFANNLVRKFRRSTNEVAQLCADLSDLRVEAGSLAQVQEALRIMTAGSISFWDACIVASAASSGCTVILTEDLTHGQTITGVRIIDPFQ